ncbi:YhgE/Pip family protein [Mycobacteroides abscessus]|uniref:YhgE/Pip N-terminal domain protein n=1 Tax=Mycobacteroides abscessus subsp. bolletii 1513 TaxID=1299321 RepID=X8DPG2_9MYCO|nr:YhgE/Pip family protein [Mycobacteroides abscessus]EUA69593.1 yhgE/Pip N-terminal domain protein [Mycobacteroides abscessus subsp. bolletii 1513]AMU75459.1 hypothetical protein A3O06_13065 [Mycobacteroides abscessus]ANO24404.1 hypothetical protein BAB79_13055 [Mycobacteroides abscessus]EIU12423.1 yhgE/Pip N-terminal domain protein [Mycobacteroides abscessus 5S-0304]EIU14168.1 yhgE/Pip N-terminal domain protein [Mycobacteroides abscessus 5S-0421]
MIKTFPARVFADANRAAPAGPPTWRTWIALAFLPILVAGLFLWAFWSPQTNHGAAKAAIVNHDQPVTIDGKTIPLGRQLAGNLTHSTAAYSWVLTDTADALNGLASGQYGAVVTIPEDFSARATSSTSPNPMQAGHAELRVQTSNATGVADPLISTQIAQIVLDTLNQQIVQTYLDNIYLSFTAIHDQLDQAATGATQLAQGADRLKTGAAQLTSGSAQLASGLGDANKKVTTVLVPLKQLPPPPPGPLTEATTQIEHMASELNTAAQGAAQLNNGANQLQTGAGQLADGAHQLATQLAQGRDQIPTYNQQQRDHLKNVTATPAIALTDNTDIGAAVAAVAVTLGLWSCALGIYVITQALPTAVLTSRASTMRIVARAVLPGTTVAALAALALGLVLLPLLNIGIGTWFWLLTIMLLTALTFVAINQAAVAILGRPGRFASIAVLALAVVTSLMSTIPGTLHTLGGYLPTHAAIVALRGIIIGSHVAADGIIQLITWLTAAALTTVIVTEQRRVLSSKQLRLHTV